MRIVSCYRGGFARHPNGAMSVPSVRVCGAPPKFTVIAVPSGEVSFLKQQVDELLAKGA